MTFLKKIHKGLDYVEKALAGISGAMILIMMFNLVIDIFVRNILGIVYVGTYERSQYVYMPMIVLPAMAFTYRSGVLPKFDGLALKGPDSWKKFVIITITIIEVIVYTLLAVYSFKSANTAFIEHKGILAGGKTIATWPVYMFLPIGFTLLAIEVLISRIIQVFDKKVAEEAKEA